MCPHEKCITCERIYVVFILLALFMNVECKKVNFSFILLIVERQAFQPSIINLKLFDAI